MRSIRIAAMAVTVAVAGVLDARAALACGGCFHPPPPPPDVPQDPTVVSEHHMVFSVSQTQTVLWDQIKYSGSPKEFAWVLPVHPGTKVELSHDEFIKALDAYTQPVVLPPVPPPYVAPKDSAFSCSCGGAADSFASAESPGAGADAGSTVSVVSDIVVGPYEVVTLHTTSGDSLDTWLAAHQFDVGATIQPIIDAYVKEQFDFIAMRLLPGKGIQSMQPVRVITPGADATLPLRMVAAGVGAKVGVLLYVIGEGRYHTVNFHDEVIDDSLLTWDNTQNLSNYSVLADQAMNGGDSRGVLTEFAGHAYSRDPAASPPNNNYGGYYGGGYYQSFNSLSQAYQEAVLYAQNNGSKCTYGTQLFDAGVDSGPDDAGLDGGPDDAGGGDGGTSPPCAFDDITVATKGMVQNDVWVTRLRMDLPVGALGDDLRLAAADQKVASNYHQVPTPGGGPSQDTSCTTSGSKDSTPPWFVFAFGGLGLTLIVRRRKR